MNYNEVFQIKPRIENAYQKVFKLEQYGFDTKSLKEELKLFNEKFDSAKLQSNNAIGNMAMQVEDDKLMSDISKLVDSFDNFLDNLLASLSMFDKVVNYNDVLNDDMDIDKLNTILKVLLNCLLEYDKLVKYGFKNDELSNNFFMIIYKAIKIEFKKTGSSTLFNALNNFGYTNNIKIFVLSDIDKLNLTKLKSNPLTPDSLLTISVIENNYIEKIIAEINNYESKKNDISSSIDKRINYIKVINEEINDNREQSSAFKNDSLQTLFSFLLSASILTGGLIGVNKAFKPKEKILFRIDKACFDTVTGEYTSDTLSDSVENDKILRIYSEVDEKGNRTVNTYKLSGESMNPEDYVSVEVSEEDLIKSSTINDSRINEKSSEEFRTVEIITNVDEQTTITEKESSSKVVLLSVVVTVLWGLADLICAYNDIGGAIYGIVDLELFDSISWLIDSVKISKTIKNKIKKVKEQEELNEKERKQLDELDKQIDEIINKFNLVLDKKKQKKLTR